MAAGLGLAWTKTPPTSLTGEVLRRPDNTEALATGKDPKELHARQTLYAYDKIRPHRMHSPPSSFHGVENL